MMASTSAGSGWTTSRIIALAAGSVLLLISLAFIAGGAALAWADQEQLRSGYLTTTTDTYSTRDMPWSATRLSRTEPGAG